MREKEILDVTVVHEGIFAKAGELLDIFDIAEDDAEDEVDNVGIPSIPLAVQLPTPEHEGTICHTHHLLPLRAALTLLYSIDERSRVYPCPVRSVALLYALHYHDLATFHPRRTNHTM